MLIFGGFLWILGYIIAGAHSNKALEEGLKSKALLILVGGSVWPILAGYLFTFLGEAYQTVWFAILEAVS